MLLFRTCRQYSGIHHYVSSPELVELIRNLVSWFPHLFCIATDLYILIYIKKLSQVLSILINTFFSVFLLKIAYTFRFKYDQGSFPEAGIEEKLISFYYINDGSTVKQIPTTLDLEVSTGEVEIEHFSFGALLTGAITNVNDGMITIPNAVEAIADLVISHFNSLTDDEVRLAEYQDNVDLLGPVMDKLDAILGYNSFEDTFPVIVDVPFKT
ncbi:hypothetical protein LCGC14_1582940 [marine sediment metagenome]|uniref:Uncharacterized protein n=1 Tax=marine sediment metagenome TaxID=412755 RepID=A0A0F9IGK2_9ZZZZ